MIGTINVIYVKGNKLPKMVTKIIIRYLVEASLLF